VTTKLEGALKREIVIDGAAYTVTLDPAGLKLVPKGRRKGYELEWSAFISGDAALAAALNAAMASAPASSESATKNKPPKAAVKAARK
jgi:hypothetical protein